ncbi:hypothetical protein VTJ83DRAFT_6064 [Remersonia thermophila]|uniref:C3H1-type domain-containing protein n=1 Tax=Remersonia thermophila TaxID=72144 RepID=A0ABR4D8X2_9PEZI
MLTDQEIERANAQLAQFRTDDELSRILDQYAVLIESYKRLKSDYEEEREAREKYKRMARDQERNPFVLVLVDGDGYVFKDSLLGKRTDGGSEAAQLLNDEVKASLRRRGLEHCQVMIRIYANVHGLSKALSKMGVVSTESRSMAPFIASFNRSYGLTEFIDAGQLKENADFKLRALLRLYAENSQCKHIYFAACHDVGYISELTPYTGHSSRFTLVDAPGVRFHDEFRKLGMGIEEFRNVFRDTPIDTALPYRNAGGVNGVNGVYGGASTEKPTLSAAKTAASASSSGRKEDEKKGEKKDARKDDKKAPCVFYAMGKCRYNTECRMSHASPPSDANSDAGHSTGWVPSGSPPGTPTTPGASVDAPGPLANLPRKVNVPRGYVPVNCDDHRLDCYLEPVTTAVETRLRKRIEQKKLCNAYHLANFCGSGDRCEFDHEPLEADLLAALERLARAHPCPRRGACRVEGCTHGHICQNLKCRYHGGKEYCRIPPAAHSEIYATARYAPSTDKHGKPVGTKTSDSGVSSSMSSSYGAALYGYD